MSKGSSTERTETFPQPESMFIERYTGLPPILFDDWERMRTWEQARFKLFGKLPDWVRRADKS